MFPLAKDHAFLIQLCHMSSLGWVACSGCVGGRLQTLARGVPMTFPLSRVRLHLISTAHDGCSADLPYVDLMLHVPATEEGGVLILSRL
jgi:hypothetical protein